VLRRDSYPCPRFVSARTLSRSGYRPGTNAEGYQVLTMVARIARLFGQTLPTDISVAVETALDLKARLACLGAIGVGTKAALLLVMSPAVTVMEIMVTTSTNIFRLPILSRRRLSFEPPVG
jgi:hypothetical protein